MRTNVSIDDSLIQEAMNLSQIKTKKDVIDHALRELVRMYKQKDLRDLRGQVQFYDDYDYKALRDIRA